MYWNSIPQKTSNSTYHKYGHFYGIMCRDFQQCSAIAKHIITVTFCFGPYNLKAGNFWKENPLDFLKKINIMKTLSFNTFLCSRPCFSIEIISLKAVLVACSYVFLNSELVYSCEKREQATKAALRQNISI